MGVCILPGAGVIGLMGRLNLQMMEQWFPQVSYAISFFPQRFLTLNFCGYLLLIGSLLVLASGNLMECITLVNYKTSIQ